MDRQKFLVLFIKTVCIKVSTVSITSSQRTDIVMIAYEKLWILIILV